MMSQEPKYGRGTNKCCEDWDRGGCFPGKTQKHWKTASTPLPGIGAALVGLGILEELNALWGWELQRSSISCGVGNSMRGQPLVGLEILEGLSLLWSWEFQESSSRCGVGNSRRALIPLFSRMSPHGSLRCSLEVPSQPRERSQEVPQPFVHPLSLFPVHPTKDGDSPLPHFSWIHGNVFHCL